MLHPVAARPGLAASWRQLVQACVHGQLVPFLGAGVSYGAELDDYGSTSGAPARMPETKDLTQSMLKAVTSRLVTHPTPDWRNLELTRLSGSSGFADAAQLFFDTVGAENERELYETGAPLDMGLFRAVLPTPAHRRIAWLAREGLFSEIITTNYDCALERALADSHSLPWESIWDKSNRTRPVRVVTCQHTYREEANSPQTLDGKKHGSVVRVHKINGCSRTYDPTDKKHHGFLVITERHLQEFGKRRWAEDLFRDRFRCRKILFSGFGAEEPQIRFTALHVIEEFSAGINDACHCFLHAWSDQPSGSQLQIARHAGPKLAGATCSDPDPVVFSGRDKAFFGEPLGPGLSPGAFWHRLYLDTVVQVIESRLERCLPFYWLREKDRRAPLAVRTAQALRLKLRHPSGDVSAWLKAFLDGDPTSHVMQLAWRARQASFTPSTNAGRGHYEPFDRVDSLPMQLLYLFHLLGIAADDVALGLRACGFWLRIPVDDAAPPDRQHRWVLVAQKRPVRFPEPPTRGASIACCLVLDKELPGRRDRRPVLYRDGGILWRILTMIDLVEQAQAEPPTLPVEIRFQRALLHESAIPKSPSLYARLAS